MFSSYVAKQKRKAYVLYRLRMSSPIRRQAQRAYYAALTFVILMTILACVYLVLHSW